LEGLAAGLRLLIRTSLVRDLLPWEALSGLITEAPARPARGRQLTFAPDRTIARIVETPTGTLLTEMGTPGDSFFFLIDGRVSVHTPLGGAGSLHPGDFSVR
jgi:hypothetical protein